MALAGDGGLLQTERGFSKINEEREAAAASGTRIHSDEEIEEAHAKLLATFKSGKTKSYEWRVEQLQGMRRFCDEQTEAICEALMEDLGRPKMEAFLGEIGSVVAELDHTVKHLKSWMAPETVPTPITLQPARSTLIREPKGVILQIAPWNFPINLSLMGLIAGVASGNCCLLKPSEMAVKAEYLLKEVLPRYVDPDAIIVVTGGVAESAALLKLRWDHILYTGNGVVARIVAKAAAEHLTPCTLELGGKTPTLVLPGANLAQAARRILSGKTFNCGQICIAPDYAMVHEDVEAQLVREMQQVLKQWYAGKADTTKDYGRIISEAHFHRIKGLIASSGGQVLQQQWQPDSKSKFIPPTLVVGPDANSPLMSEEIFGPVLPIVKMKSVKSMVDHINAGEKPLAMYIFGSEADADAVIRDTSSGGVCVNDTIVHISNSDLPFGGVGASGMGRYHGKFGFDEFSHLRSVVYRATWIDPSLRYPPYKESDMKMLQRIVVGPLLPPGVKKAITAFGGAAMASVAALAVRSRL